MSEQEFENWLALLSGLLKLSPEQRQNIADELRSHLEERMEDLIDAGSSREEAIGAALAEFGDTAALAHHFTTIAHQKRRRLMRYTYGTIAAVTCSILVLAAFWPGPQAPLTPQGIAQSQPDKTVGAESLGTENGQSQSPEPLKPVLSDGEIAKKLSEPLEKIDYEEKSLPEIIDDLSVRTGLTFATPSSSNVSWGSYSRRKTSLHLPEKSVNTRTLLYLLFREFDVEDELGFTVRNSQVVITDKQNARRQFIYTKDEIEAVLDEPMPKVEIFQMPLRELTVDLSELIGIPIFFDPEEVGDVIDPDVPIDLQVPANMISYKTFLDFILVPNDLTYHIRDNVLVISSYDKWIANEKATEVAVYDCQDLLTSRQPEKATAGHKTARGETGTSRLSGELASTPGTFNEYSGETDSKPATNDETLIRVISNTVAPGSWVVAGQAPEKKKPESSAGSAVDIYGSIDSINGMIVIKHTREVHKQVKELLKSLREAQSERGHFVGGK